MDTSKEGIKDWLARHTDRDRNWLADKCGVEKKTVDNWLSSPREIPSKALLIIEDLMRADAETERPEDVADVVAMPIRVTPMQFDDYTRAFKQAGDVATFREWIMSRLDAAAEADLASGFEEEKESPSIVPAPPSNLIELPFYGTVAAGLPGGPLDSADGTHPVPGSYDLATHYVLRVNGQSMEPDYPDGSHVVCRKLKDGEFAKKGQDVIACDASGAYFKRLVYQKDGVKGDAPRKAVPRLVSINPDFPEVAPLADCPIVAVVVGKA